MTLCQEAFESTQIMVFVIDDDPSVRKSLSRLLSSVGLRSKTFASPEEFLTTERYDGVGCIVLDVRMPGISGPDLQDRLVRENCTLPIVFITGHGSLPMAVTALKKGAVDFLRSLSMMSASWTVLGGLSAHTGSSREQRPAVL